MNSFRKLIRNAAMALATFLAFAGNPGLVRADVRYTFNTGSSVSPLENYINLDIVHDFNTILPRQPYGPWAVTLDFVLSSRLAPNSTYIFYEDFKSWQVSIMGTLASRSIDGYTPGSWIWAQMHTGESGEMLDYDIKVDFTRHVDEYVVDPYPDPNFPAPVHITGTNDVWFHIVSEDYYGSRGTYVDVVQSIRTEVVYARSRPDTSDGGWSWYWVPYLDADDRFAYFTASWGNSNPAGPYWTITELAAPVPEPEILGFLVAGMALLKAKTWRNRART